MNRILSIKLALIAHIAMLLSTGVYADSIKIVTFLTVAGQEVKTEKSIGFAPTENTITVQVAGRTCTFGSSNQGYAPKGCNYAINITANGVTPENLDSSPVCSEIPMKCEFATNNPIAAAWMYMSDNQQYNTVPSMWSDINFKDVDVLYVGPAGIQADGNFGLYNSSNTGDLSKRFKWIIQAARTQNPNIKIIVSQWWGNGDGIWGKALNTLNSDAAIEKYTTSVAAFLESYLDVNGGIDGYDIDYESNNVVRNISSIIAQVRTKIDSKAKGNRTFYLTVSPDTTEYLEEVVSSLDFVNMQTYAGGRYLTPQDFTNIGLKSQQLLYGICPETNCPTPSVEEVEAKYIQNQLAGIHLWRLNSDNYACEAGVQAEIYHFLHYKEKNDVMCNR